MKPTSCNVGYRKILLGRTSLKAKLAALARMPQPSSNLLTAIIRDPNANPKLKLLATDRLAELLRQREIDKALKEEKSK